MSKEDFSPKRPEKGPTWINIPLDPFFERYNDERLGIDTEITYATKKTGLHQTVRGILVEVNPHRSIILQDRFSAELIKLELTLVTLTAIKAVRLPERKTSFYRLPASDFLQGRGGRNDLPATPGFIIIHAPTKDSEQSHLISGLISIRTVDDQYPVLHILDANGVEHLIDPVQVRMKLVLCRSAEGITSFVPPKHPISILDQERPERTRYSRMLIEGLDVLDNPLYYEYFEKDPERAQKILALWYPEPHVVKEMCAQAERRLGPAGLALLADPGIVQQFDVFLAFTEQLRATAPSLSTIELRRRFSEHLGTKTIYRGMWLTEEELLSVHRFGILAPAFQKPEVAIQVLQGTLDPTKIASHMMKYTRSFREEIFGRLTDFHDRDTLTSISVSAYEPVARSAGYYNGAKKPIDDPDLPPQDEPKKSFYVFTCNAPVISLIRQENLFELERRSEATLQIGDLVLEEKTDLDIELFTPYYISPSCITHTEAVTQPPPRWKRTEPIT